MGKAVLVNGTINHEIQWPTQSFTKIVVITQAEQYKFFPYIDNLTSYKL